MNLRGILATGAESVNARPSQFRVVCNFRLPDWTANRQTGGVAFVGELKRALAVADGEAGRRSNPLRPAWCHPVGILGR